MTSKKEFLAYIDVIKSNQDASTTRACNCIGRQNGQPVCPCQMRSVSVEDGRYVQTIDLGPAA